MSEPKINELMAWVRSDIDHTRKSLSILVGLKTPTAGNTRTTFHERIKRLEQVLYFLEQMEGRYDDDTMNKLLSPPRGWTASSGKDTQ